MKLEGDRKGRLARTFAWVVGMSTVGVGATAHWREKHRRVTSDALPPAIDAARETLHRRAFGALSYYIDRKSQGRPLVLVHGIHAAASAIEVRPLFERYRGERTVIAVDLPGFGCSGRSDIDYSPMLYVDALVALLEQEAPEGADLVALNLSCEFVARVARDRPELVRSLVLIGPTGLGEDDSVPEPLARWVRFPLVGPRLFDLLVSRVSIQQQFAKAFEGRVDDELAEYAYRSARCEGARYAATAFLRGHLSTPDARKNIYERVQVPTLIVHDDGGYANFSQVPTLVAENPNVYAEQVGHARAYPHFEEPEMTFLLLEQAWGQNAAAHSVWR